jgi:hypothetical protein
MKPLRGVIYSYSSLYTAVQMGEGGLMTTIFFDNLAKLRFYGQNGQSKFDHDHPQEKKFMVIMVNPYLIITISTIPDIFVVEIVEIGIC